MTEHQQCRAACELNALHGKHYCLEHQSLEALSGEDGTPALGKPEYSPADRKPSLHTLAGALKDLPDVLQDAARQQDRAERTLGRFRRRIDALEEQQAGSSPSGPFTRRILAESHAARAQGHVVRVTDSEAPPEFKEEISG